MRITKVFVAHQLDGRRSSAMQTFVVQLECCGTCVRTCVPSCARIIRIIDTLGIGIISRTHALTQSLSHCGFIKRLYFIVLSLIVLYYIYCTIYYWICCAILLLLLCIFACQICQDMGPPFPPRGRGSRCHAEMLLEARRLSARQCQVIRAGFAHVGYKLSSCVQCCIFLFGFCHAVHPNSWEYVWRVFLPDFFQTRSTGVWYWLCVVFFDLVLEAQHLQLVRPLDAFELELEGAHAQDKDKEYNEYMGKPWTYYNISISQN